MFAVCENIDITTIAPAILISILHSCLVREHFSCPVLPTLEHVHKLFCSENSRLIYSKKILLLDSDITDVLFLWLLMPSHCAGCLLVGPGYTQTYFVILESNNKVELFEQTLYSAV